MNVEKFFLSLLNLGDDWMIESVVQDGDTDILVHVKYKHAKYCIVNGIQYKIYDHAPSRMWQHLSVFQFRSYIVCKVPRYINEQGEVHTLTVSWAESYQSYTNMFADCIIDMLQAVQVQKKVAELGKTSTGIVRRIMEQAIERGLIRRGEVKNLRHISLDEKSIQHGHEYAGIIIDRTENKVIEVAEGRSSDAMKATLYNATGEEKYPGIKTVTMDMWKPFINVVDETMPNAQIAFDKFHLFKKLSEAIDKTRRYEVKTEPLLKFQKYNVLKSQATRTSEQQRFFEQIDAANLQTAKVWKIRENFKAVFEATDEIAAIELYDIWLNNAARNANRFVMDVLKTFERHLDGIINAIVLNINNAVHERINGTIQTIITKARGFKTFERFRINILFYCGKLSLYH